MASRLSIGSYLLACLLTLLSTRVVYHKYENRKAASAETIHVLSPKDLPKVSAMLLNETSMGSSTVLRSSDQGSDLLTNHHVCEDATKAGGRVILNHKTYIMRAIKPSNDVDLCLVHVDENLHVNTELADTAPEVGDEILTGGYPLVLPMVIQKGYVGGIINLGTALDPFYGLVTSVLVEGGHSGTGVFNSQGKLTGVLMLFKFEKAEDSMGFGIAVPWRETKRFVEVESLKLPWTLVPYAGT